VKFPLNFKNPVIFGETQEELLALFIKGINLEILNEVVIVRILGKSTFT
jgi:siroheme synthase